MIIQTFQTFNEYTGGNGSLSDFFTYPASVWAGWVPLLLFALYMIVLFASYHSSKRFGEGSFAISTAVAGFVTMVASFIMLLIPNMTNVYTVVVCVVVALGGVMFLLSQKNKY